MSRFKVGQQVICIKTHTQKAVIKGKTYTIQGIEQVCECATVDVGINSSSDLKRGKCVVCGVIWNTDGIHHIAEYLFAPLEEDGTSLSLVCDMEEGLFIPSERERIILN